MAIGVVNLSMGLGTQNFQDGMAKVNQHLKQSLDQAKTLMIGAAIGSYLMTGANEAIDASVDQMYAKLNLMDQGLSEAGYEQIAAMAEKFELLGSNAEVAQLKIAEFVIQGKSIGLKELGIYIDKDTTAMMKNMSVAERLQYVMSEFPDKLAGMEEMLPEQTKNMLAMRKTMDDLREAMGISFLGAIKGITDAFGGVIPAMKTAIIAFTAYKTAMILGNVGIGISKTIAQTGVLGAPIALAMGAAALAAIGGLIGGAALAVNALNSIPDPEEEISSTSSNNTANQNITIQITDDKFGQTAKVVNNAGGSSSSSVQTNFGS